MKNHRLGVLSMSMALVGLVVMVIANFEVGWIARIVDPPYGVQFAVNEVSGYVFLASIVLGCLGRGRRPAMVGIVVSLLGLFLWLRLGLTDI